MRPSPLAQDLKSPNILIDERFRIKIGDFGLSVMQQHSFVSSGHGGGTPEWMAPEVLRSERYGCSADVYRYASVLSFSKPGVYVLGAKGWRAT